MSNMGEMNNTLVQPVVEVDQTSHYSSMSNAYPLSSFEVAMQSQLGVGNNTLTQPVNVNIDELNATVDLSKVTMRKNKKSKDVNPSSNQPILASSGPIITEWSGDYGDIELSTIVDKNNQVKPVSLDPLVNDPKGPGF